MMRHSFLKSKLISCFRKDRIIFVLLLGIVLSFCGIVAIHAQDEYTASPLSNRINNFDKIYKDMYETIEAGNEYIELSEYNISTDDVFDIFYDLYLNSPEFFFLENRIEFYYTNSENREYVTRVYFLYSMSSQERKKAESEYEKELDYIVSQVDVHMTDVEKALWVHDYFASSYEYDNDMSIYDAYNLFTQRKGICQAYSLGYVAVMRELGIETYTISSEKMNHSWNIVNIDGEWYHVDVVFDDPTPDKTGAAQHNYFLLSDDEIENAKNPHSGWQSRYSCVSDKYSNSMWKNVASRMDYSNGKWYYIDSDEGTLVSCAYASPEKKNELFTFEDKWYMSNDETRYWNGIYSGVSISDSKVYVNTPHEIVSVSLSDGKTSLVFSDSENETIYGMRVYKNVLEYNVADSPNSTEHKISQIKIKDPLPIKTKKQMRFDDVSRLDKSYYAVEYVYRNGLFNGVSENKFAPKSTLTRAMFVTVLGRLCGIDISEYDGTGYSDVQTGLWYSPYIEWARQTGLVNGVGEDVFAPNNVITREQGYKISAAFCAMYGYGTGSVTDVKVGYGDKDLISSWAMDGVRFCIKNKIISVGNVNTMLEPNLPLTREETALIVYKLALIADYSISED